MAASEESSVGIAQLCKACRQLENIDQIIVDGELWTHDDQWPELPLLETSAKSGCDFCRLLRQSLLSAPGEQPWPDETLARVHIIMLPMVKEIAGDNSRPAPALCGFWADLRFPRSRSRMPWTTVKRVAFVTWADSNAQIFHPQLGVNLKYESSDSLDVRIMLGSFKGLCLVANSELSSVRRGSASILLRTVT